MGRPAYNNESVSLLNVVRLCEKFGCIPSQIMQEDHEMVTYMEFIVKLDNEKAKKESLKKKNGR